MNLLCLYIPLFVGISITIITSSQKKKKQHKIFIWRYLLKVVGSKFLLCKLTLCPAPNQSIKEEYTKCCEKLGTIIITGRERNDNVFNEWENKRFQHEIKTFKSPEDTMKCSEINKVCVKLSNWKKLLQMISKMIYHYFHYIWHFRVFQAKPYISKLKQQLYVIWH